MLKRGWTKLKQTVFSPRPVPTRDEIQQQLMTVFDFQEEDLEANRLGKMSRHQHYWFVDRFLRAIPVYLVFTAIAGLVFHNALTNPVPFGGAIGMLWVPLWGVAFISVVVTGIIYLGNMSLDMVLRRMDTASGIGKTHSRRAGKGPIRYYVNIGAAQFEISEREMQAIIDDEQYTVYYAAHSRIILAVEVE